MATKKYNEKKQKNYSNTSVKQKLFFAFAGMTILRPPLTMTNVTNRTLTLRKFREITMKFLDPL